MAEWIITKGLYQIWGPPGCAKTTRMADKVLECVEQDRTVLITSLTRAALAEVRSRHLPIPPEAMGTLHAHCYHGLGRPTIVEGQHVAIWNEEFPQFLMSGAEHDTSVDDLLSEPRQVTPTDHVRAHLDVLRAQRIPVETWDEAMPFWTCWCDFKAQMGLMDFTDLLETALEELPVAPGAPDVIFADEAQDHSQLELAVLLQWFTHARALCLIGDPWQNLFEWRGTEPHIFLDLPAPDGHRHLLPQSYRVPRAVRDFAMDWMAQHYSAYQDLDYRAREAEGQVVQGFIPNRPEWSMMELIDLLSQTDHQGRPATVMWLASCAYMLRPALKVFRAHGLPFANPYRTTRGDWNPLRGHAKDILLTYLRPNAEVWGDEARLWTFAELQRWVHIIKADGILKRGAKATIEKVDDPIKLGRPIDLNDLDDWFLTEHWRGILQPTAEWLLAHALPNERDKLFYPLACLQRGGRAALREPPRLYVGTYHSVKGGEATHVYCDPSLSPAAEHQWWEGAEARDQVCRTFYVGMTRARESLHLGHALSSRAVPW
jgi:DNA helicase II / ATP-dependent DNA helicase PcrA